MQKYLTALEVAEVLNVDRSRVYRLFKRKRNRLPGIRISENTWRCGEDDLAAWLKQQEKRAA